MQVTRGCVVGLLLLIPMTTGAAEPPAAETTLGAAEVRWRFLGGGLYAVGTGGTLLYPEGDGTLRPGGFASMGLGVDHAS